MWVDACLVMGRELAALAIAIVSTKDPEHFKSSPGGYFNGMVAKHVAGDLRLERTVWALRNAADPEQYARKNRQSEMRGWPIPSPPLSLLRIPVKMISHSGRR